MSSPLSGVGDREGMEGVQEYELWCSVVQLVMLWAWLGLKALAWAWPERAWPRPGPSSIFVLILVLR